MRSWLAAIAVMVLYVAVLVYVDRSDRIDLVIPANDPANQKK